MGGPVPVRAGWAAWGKRPGTSEDYSILSAATQPLSRAEYASIVAHFTPGTPPREQGRPGSLPWVTFSQVGVDSRPYLGISVQDLVNQVDGVGRPITQTSYFCAPYADLAQPPVSCLGLYRAVADLTLPDQDGEPADLTIAPFDPAAMAAMIRKLGVDMVATTASLLLGAPVTVTGADGSTLLERLWFIDVVAALLPFAYRAGYTAATWSDNGAGQRIRLAFSSHPATGAATVGWRSPPTPIKADGPARRYRQLLASVLDRQSASDPLTELIRSLATLTDPARRFDDPQYALDALREIDLPAVILDAARRGAATPDEIRSVFASGRIAELPDASRKQLLEKLIAFGDQQDWTTVRRWFDPIAGQDADEMLGAVSRTCRKLLWSPVDAALVREYLILADHYDREDELMATLMIPPKAAENLSHGIGTAARLLADSVFATASSRAAAYPRTRKALAKNPAVACELLSQLAGSDAGTGPAIAWLEPALGAFLRPFISILADTPSAPGQQALDQLAAHGVNWVRALMRTASNANRLDYAAPGFAGWLAARAAENGLPDQAMRQYWRNTAGALAPGTEVSRAWLDLCLLLTGNDPVFMLAEAGDGTRFRECLAASWQQLVAVAPGVDELLTTALTGYLEREAWAASAGQAAAVADLASRLTPDGRRGQLEAAVTRKLAAAPGAANWDFAARWADRVAPVRPGTIESLTYMPASATHTEIAETCVRAARRGVGAREASQALADSGVIRSGAQADSFLEELRVATMDAADEQVDTGQWLLVFIELFTSGAFGPRVAAEFPAQVISSGFMEMRYRLAMLRYTASGGRKDAPLVLTAAAIAELEQICEVAAGIIRDAREGGGSGGTSRPAARHGADVQRAPS